MNILLKKVMARKVKPRKTASDWMALKTSARFKIELLKIEFQYYINYISLILSLKTMAGYCESYCYIRHCKFNLTN